MASLLKLFRSGTAAALRAMSTKPMKKEKDGMVLFRRLAALGLRNSDGKVADVLDEWAREGHEIRRPQVTSFASELRRFNKPHIALQVPSFYSLHAHFVLNLLKLEGLRLD